MSETADKRRKIVLSKDESEILRWLFIKTLIPVVIIMIVSSAVLYFGLDFLMKKTSFGNYGIAPSATLWNVSQFISTYMTIAITNIVLMILLCVIVIYIILRNMVLPVLRITRELKQCIEAKSKPAITVRKSDKLLIPLVEMINKLS